MPTETDEVIGELQNQLRELQKQHQYRIYGIVDVAPLLNLPEDVVTDITDDLDANIVAQKSPFDDQESDDEGVDVG
jgi:hypothetical protein